MADLENLVTYLAFLLHELFLFIFTATIQLLNQLNLIVFFFPVLEH